MIKNYFIIAWRNLRKNGISSFINISGLALATGCCIVVFVFLDWAFHQDSFHSKLNKLYVVEKIVTKDGNQKYEGDSPAPIGDMLKSDFPQIVNSARIDYVNSVMKQGDNIFRETVSYVDDSFYKMFDFPVKWGNKVTFTEQNGIVLTEELAQKLFDNENPVGKNISLSFNIDSTEVIENFTIQGVFEKRPHESSFYFSALIPFKKMLALGLKKDDDWSQNVSMTFVETVDETSVLPADYQYIKYLNLYNAANKDSKITAYHFQPLHNMNLHSYKLGQTRFMATNIIGYIMLTSIAVAILLLVSFNYINIAIASAANRFKEIGVRKVMGSSRNQVIYQFILENLILCTIGVLLGLIVARTVFIPWFSQIGGLDLTNKMMTNPRVWLFLVALSFMTILGGAAYPSFYISSLKPVNILGGKLTLGSKNRFRKVLLGFQFFLTFIGISMALAFVKENKISRAKPWGYNPANNVVVKTNGAAEYETFKNNLLINNKITAVTGSVEALGSYSRQMIVRNDGAELTIKALHALPGFATHFGVKIINGRDLSESFETDKSASVLVNEAFLKSKNWKTAIGKTIEYDNKKYTIVGEISDFRFENLQNKIEPLLLFGCTASEIGFTYVKTEPSLLSNGHKIVENIWKRTSSKAPFDFYYQDAVFDNYFDGFNQVIRILSAASFIMIIVCICGIFGLALLILGKKMKDLSVRKVLGASLGNISFQIIKEFLYAIGFAFVIGVPISFLLTRTIFSKFTPESVVSFIPLLSTVILLVFITLLSVSWHMYKAYVSNPTSYLKNE